MDKVEATLKANGFKKLNALCWSNGDLNSPNTVFVQMNERCRYSWEISIGRETVGTYDTVDVPSEIENTLAFRV